MFTYIEAPTEEIQRQRHSFFLQKFYFVSLSILFCQSIFSTVNIISVQIYHSPFSLHWVKTVSHVNENGWYFVILDPRKGNETRCEFSLILEGREEDGLNFGILCQMFSWQNCAREDLSLTHSLSLVKMKRRETS